jgi:hypothetical protein
MIKMQPQCVCVCVGEGGGAVRIVQSAARVDVGFRAHVEVATGSFGNVAAAAVTEANSRN